MTGEGIPVRIHVTAEQLRRLERIAARRGCTVRHVIETHLTAGMAPRELQATKPDHRLDAERIALVESMTYAGASAREIAERIGCSQATVTNWRRKLGLLGVRPRGRYAKPKGS